MSLVVHISINNQTMVGVATMQRVEGGIGKACRYRCEMVTRPHPLTGESINVKDVTVDHHYNDDPTELVCKALTAMREASRKGDES